MKIKNVEWAAKQIERFLALSNGEFRGDPYDGGVWFESAGGEDDIREQWVIVRQILDRVMPGWHVDPNARSGYESDWKPHRDLAIELKAVVTRHQEIEDNLGDGAPSMSAANLHPWVWEGARTLWQSRHFRSAVEDAAKKVNAETQNKVGRRDVSETDLFKQAFTIEDAKPGVARLRRMAPDGSDTYRSMQRGAMALAEGIYAGIRNPFNHESPQDIEEQVALEYLAALSVLARWVDGSELETR